MTQIIVEALETTGQRGIINKGWGGLGNCKFPFPSASKPNPISVHFSSSKVVFYVFNLYVETFLSSFGY